MIEKTSSAPVGNNTNTYKKKTVLPELNQFYPGVLF